MIGEHRGASASGASSSGNKLHFGKVFVWEWEKRVRRRPVAGKEAEEGMYEGSWVREFERVRKGSRRLWEWMIYAEY